MRIQVTREALYDLLYSAKEAGMNMLRVSAESKQD